MEKSGLTAHRLLTILRIHQNHRHETFCFLSACTDILSVIYIRSASMNADNSLIWPVWQQQPIFDEVKNGEIWIGDKLVNSLPPEERGIAMIFQNYTVYPRMTVLENVELGLRLRGIDEKEIGKRTLEVLELLDLVEVRFAKVKNLSDLWKHRTALARAMILEPDVILMDEPLRNVSPKFHHQLTQELVELQERTGVTILYATKNVEEMALLGKRKVMV